MASKEIKLNILNMIGWGILAFLLTNLSVKINGIEGGVSDLREIAAFAGILFISNWWYALGIGIFAALGGPYDSSLPITLLMHIITIPLAFFLYKKIVNKAKSIIIYSLIWILEVAVLYIFSFSFLFVLGSYLFGFINVSNSIYTFFKFLSGVKLELFITAFITTFILVIKYFKDIAKRNLKILDIAAKHNIFHYVWLLDEKGIIKYLIYKHLLIKLVDNPNTTLNDFLRRFSQFTDKDKIELFKQKLTDLKNGKIDFFDIDYPLYVSKDIKQRILTKCTVYDRNQDGSVKSIIGISIDITAIYNTMEENKNLQEQLLQTQKMQAIGLLAGGVAHDFNNLLTVITGYSDMLVEMTNENDEIREYVTGINKSAEKAAKLTSQLLAFSRKQVYNPEVINLNDLIISLKTMLKRLISEDIDIEFYLDENLELIEADNNQIEQIIINLVLNARDAVNAKNTKDKKITIETRNIIIDDVYYKTHSETKPGSYVALFISDNGIGMSKEVKEHIFEPFFTTKEKGVGTGLGLSTVYGIVKQNNGSIYVYTEEGKGTTFKINWPASNIIRKENFDKDNDKILTGNEKILLVEDNSELREFSILSLKNLGYNVKSAKDGLEALNFLNDGYIPDLLITDVVMPNMDGTDLAGKAKEILPDLKILFLSGYTDNHIVHNGQLKKGVNFLQKPYRIKELSKKIKEVLQQK